MLRNPVLGDVFFRLHYIEMFGTGVKRIKEAYQAYSLKPIFEVFENSIKVTLPAVDVLPFRKGRTSTAGYLDDITCPLRVVFC